MNRLLLYLFIGSLAIFPAGTAQAQTTSLTISNDEILLEGRITVVDESHGEVQIEATAFELPSGHRRELEPPKTKTIHVSDQTQFFDERTRLSASLHDLKVGLTVRVAGHDNGSGQPLSARVLHWRSPGPAIPVSPSTSSETPSPLPESQTWHNIDLSVVDAGFKPDSHNIGEILNPPWTLTVRSHSLERVNFVELQTPEVPVTYSQSSDTKLPDGSVERTFRFPGAQIDPRWPSMRARFEMMDKAAPPNAKGSFVTRLPAEIPIPDKPNGVLEPHLSWTGPNEFKVELVRVEAKDEEKHLKLEWKLTPLTENADAKAYLDTISFQSGDKSLGDVQDDLFGRSNGTNRTVIEDFAMLPRGAPLKGQIYLRVYASSLRKREFIHTVNFDLPISKLATAHPLHYQMPFLSPVDKEAEDTEFRWEGTPNGAATLWVSPQNEAEAEKNHTRLLLRSLTVSAPGETDATYDFDGRFYESRGNTFWHSDGTSAGTLETGWRVARPNFGRNCTLHLTATVASAQVSETEHHFSEIPLPRSGETQILTEDKDEWVDDTATVRKIAWVPYGTPEYQSLEKVTGGMGQRGTLVIVCEVPRMWPNSFSWLGDLSFNFDGLSIGGTGRNPKVNSTHSDVFATEPSTKSFISFFVQPPSGDEKYLDMSFHINEVVLSPAKKLIIDSISLP